MKRTTQAVLGHTAREYVACSNPPPERTGKRIRGSASVFDAVRDDLEQAPQEIMIALMLDAQYRVLRKVIVGVGTLSSVDCHPREVFREAVRCAAAAIIVTHNHPSGSAEPSADDIALTSRLKEAGKILGIPVLDHLVIVAGGYVSLADRGVL